MEDLVREVRNCRICEAHLPAGPRPVFTVHPDSKVVIIGQAPGSRVHASGIPWDDPSGDRLRRWLAVDRDTFYQPASFAILPMGFCYPGSGKSGDLPPRPECAPTWHRSLLQLMPQIRLTLLIGSYAQPYYLGDRMQRNMTETVRNWQSYLPEFLPLPHPSPRNVAWFKRNPWFEKEVIPELQSHLREVGIGKI